MQQTTVSRRRRGQTFMEVMGVVIILAIIAGIVTFAVAHARSRAQVSASISTMHEISAGLESYYADNNAYPPGSGTNVTPTLFGGNPNGWYNASPLSPNNGAAYTYTYQAAGAPYYYIDDPGTYVAGALMGVLNSLPKGTDGSDTVTAPPSNACTKLAFNPDIGAYCK